MSSDLSRHPRVWAIVLMYGGEDVTVACIESLLAQDFPALTVLLVDNASPGNAGTRVRARFPGIEFLETGENLGYTGGNNRGIRYALERDAEYLFVLNNDTTLDPSCVSTLVASARNAGATTIIAPKILYHGDPRRIWYAGGDLSVVKAIGVHRRQFQLDTPNEPARLDPITFVTGCAFLMPAEVARKLGGFAEDFFTYCEDVELSLRAQRAGYRMYHQPAARVYHHDELTSHPSPVQVRMRDRNRRRVARRHYAALDRLRFMTWFYPTRAARMLQYLLRGDLARAKAIVAGAVEP